jgi:hypothetical protein
MNNLMNEFGTVIWADPYIRFNPVYLRDIVKASQQYGIQVAKNNEKVRITNQEVRHKIVKYLNEEKYNRFTIMPRIVSSTGLYIDFTFCLNSLSPFSLTIFPYPIEARIHGNTTS